MAHTQVIRTVQHAAVGVAAAVDHIAVTLGSRHVHDGAVEVFGDEGLRRLGTEVAQEHRQGVAARGLDLLDSLEHIGLVFHRDAALIRLKAFGLAGGHDVLAAPGGQGNGETVAADSHNAQADFGNVGRLHSNSSVFYVDDSSYRSFSISMFSPVRAATAPWAASAESG